MRRSATIAAASLAAIAWAMPAAAAGEQVYYTITFQEGRLSAAPPSASGSVAKVDSFTVKQSVKPYKLDRVFVKSWSTSGDASMLPGSAGGVRVASGDVNDSSAPRPVRPSDVTMKRGTSAGMDGINRLIIVTQVKGGCEVGKLYPSATMEGGGKSYALTDVRITGCESAGPEEQITFVYGKVKVRGWDPKKKEE